MCALLFFFKNRDLSKSDHVCGGVSWYKQGEFLRTSEKVVDAYQAGKGKNVSGYSRNPCSLNRERDTA